MQRDVGRNIETKQGTAIKAFWEEKQGGDKKREVGIQTSAKEWISDVLVLFYFD